MKKIPLLSSFFLHSAASCPPPIGEGHSAARAELGPSEPTSCPFLSSPLPRLFASLSFFFRQPTGKLTDELTPATVAIETSDIRLGLEFVAGGKETKGERGEKGEVTAA